ncbi:MAG: site-specific DNA-methyltransferase [Roseiflexaceae bacterium]|nr:site-specific DNA-methyltransferase [Roseiflexaceae bacterium]
MILPKLRPTFTFDQERIEALKAIAPEAFADGKINWEALREALGEHLEDEDRNAEHFGLFWHGKRAARRLASLPSAGTLIPAPGEGVNETTTRHLFIEGDNLEALKLLQKSYAGRVKMIYIDPPYNTGNDFIYSDNFTQPLEEYLRATGQADDMGRVLVTNTKAGGRYHSTWLTMMYPRLRLARALLRDDGVIFVSIDDNEVHHLRMLMNEVFGEENFLATVIWQKIYAPKSSAKHFSADHDYILVYAKHGELWTPELLPRTEEQDSVYKNPDNDPRGPWRPNNLAARNYYSKGLYSIKCPGGRFIPGPPKGSYWRISEEKLWSLHREGRIWWGEDGNNVPAPKIYLSEVKRGRVPQTLWLYEDVGHTQEAKKELLEFVTFEDTDNVLDTVKPTRLLQRMLQVATSADGEDIVLDFFAGSAVTAHAVLKQNREDGGNRRFIVVQFPEPLPKPEPALRTIADIGKERIRRVIARMQAEQSGRLDLTERAAPEDLGFRVFKLGRSHYKAWQDFDGDDLEALQARFDAFESPLVEGWQPENLLVEIMLIEGFPLDSTVETLPEFTANTVRRVSSDALAHCLYVCLDEQVAEATIVALPLSGDDLFICLDRALSDEAKVRLADGRRVKVI